MRFEQRQPFSATWFRRRVQLHEPANSSPLLTIGCGEGRFGELTNFTFGSTGSVSLLSNATVSASAGNLPTRAQLGGAILLSPVTAADTGSFAVGDDGSTSIFGGVSLGSWTTVGGVPVSGGRRSLPATAR